VVSNIKAHHLERALQIFSGKAKRMDLTRAALSLVIHKQGAVTEIDVDDLLDRYKRKQGIAIDKADFLQALSHALQHYESRTKCLFVCTEGPCQKATFIHTDPTSLQKLSRELGCEVEDTGCHWQCEVAPVLTFKTETTVRRFGSCASEQAVFDMCTAIVEMI
jgi:hypothetical protein